MYLSTIRCKCVRERILPCSAGKKTSAYVPLLFPSLIHSITHYLLGSESAPGVGAIPTKTNSYP